MFQMTRGVIFIIRKLNKLSGSEFLIPSYVEVRYHENRHDRLPLVATRTNFQSIFWKLI